MKKKTKAPSKTQHDHFKGVGDQADDFLTRVIGEISPTGSSASESTSDDVTASARVSAELEEVVKKDAPELKKLLQELSKNARELKKHLAPTVEKAKNGEYKSPNGLSLLELKNQTLFQYITNLVFFVCLKLDGKRLENHPVVDRLIELRVVLEKIKPLEQKLKYQIDKLVKAAMISETEGGAESQGNLDALQFKPNPLNLANDGMGEQEEESREPSDGIYRPPKLAPMVYEEDSSKLNRRKRQEARIAERASKSRLMQDLVAEFDDRPEEEAADGVAVLGGADADVATIRERDQYEEDNFVRLTESKKDMKMRRRAGEKRLQDDLKNLSDFGSLAGIRSMEERSGGDFDLLERRKKRRQAAAGSDDDEHHVESGNKRKRGGGDTFDGLLGSIDQGGNEFRKQKKRLNNRKKRR